MGRRGPLPRQKDAEGKPLDPSSAIAVLERQQQIADQAGAIVDAPPPPRGLLPASREVWADFWGSKPARWVDRGAAMNRLVRWIRDVDMYERISRELRPRRRQAIGATIPGVVDVARPWLGRGAADQICRTSTSSSDASSIAASSIGRPAARMTSHCRSSGPTCADAAN